MAAKKARKQKGQPEPKGRQAAPARARTKAPPAPAPPAAARRRAAPATPKRGRPTVRTKDLEVRILEWVSDGKSLRSFCRQPGMPSHVTVHEWRKADPVFSERFARAREIGADMIADEVLDIVDTPMLGRKTTVIVGGGGDEEEEDGEEGTEGGGVVTKTVTEDMLGHRRLRADARLKLLAKWFPQKYGDRVGHDHTGTVTFDMILREALGLLEDKPK